MNIKKIKNKTILITGASSGIGEALAYQMAAYGANIIITGRRKERLESIAGKIRADGGNALPVPVDVNKDEDFEVAVAKTNDTYGNIDIAIANAAIPQGGDFDSLTLEDYRNSFETNLFGLLRTAYACLDDLKKTNGSLVLIGSIAGYTAFPGSSTYAMTKFAVRAFAEAVHYELAAHGINVLLISPGFIRSELRMVDNRGVYHPEYEDYMPSWLVMSTQKAAHKIIKAIAKRKRAKIVTLHGYVIYGLRQFLPWLYFLILNFAKKFAPTPRKG